MKNPIRQIVEKQAEYEINKLGAKVLYKEDIPEIGAFLYRIEKGGQKSYFRSRCYLFGNAIHV